MFSHIYLIEGGFTSLSVELSREECEQLHISRHYQIPESRKVISQLDPTRVNTGSLTLHGSLDSDGGCTGVSMTDPVTGSSSPSIDTKLLIVYSIRDPSGKLTHHSSVRHPIFYCDWTL